MKIKSVIYFSLSMLLSACDSGENQAQKDQKEAIADARLASPESYHEYLQCYALQDQDKLRCSRLLNDKYIKPNQGKKVYYALNYAYESEKLGFVGFLQKQGVACDGMEVSPEFARKAGTYVAMCTNGGLYLLRFDSNKKEWQFIK